MDKGRLIERVTSLPKENRIALRRSFGKALDDASFRALTSLYMLYDAETKEDDEIHFFVLTLVCYYGDYAENGIAFKDALSKYYYTDISDSEKKRIMHLMDKPRKKRGMFYKELASIIKKIARENIFIDATDLSEALKKWNWNSRVVQKSVAEAIAKAMK